MRKLYNFKDLLSSVFILTGDRTSEKLLSEVANKLDLSQFIIIDLYALERSPRKDELKILSVYLDSGLYGKIQRLRRGCQLIPITIGELTYFKLSGFGRVMYLLNYDNFSKLEKNVKEYSVKTHKRNSN